MWLLLVFCALLSQSAAAGNESFNTCLSSRPMYHARLPRFDLVFLVDATLSPMQYNAAYNYLRVFGCTLTYSEMYGFDVAVAEYDDAGADIRLPFGQLDDRRQLFTALIRLQNVTSARRDSTAAEPRGDLCKALQALQAPLKDSTRTNSTKLLHTVLSVEPKCDLLNELAAFKQAWGNEAETWSLLPLVPDGSFNGSSLIASLTTYEDARRLLPSTMNWTELSVVDDTPHPLSGYFSPYYTTVRATALVAGRAAAEYAHYNVFSPTTAPPPTTAPSTTTAPPSTTAPTILPTTTTAPPSTTAPTTALPSTTAPSTTTAPPSTAAPPPAAPSPTPAPTDSASSAKTTLKSTPVGDAKPTGRGANAQTPSTKVPAKSSESDSDSTWLYVGACVGLLVVLLMAITVMVYMGRKKSSADVSTVKLQEPGAVAPPPAAGAAGSASKATEPGEAPTQNDSGATDGSLGSTQKESSPLTPSNVELTQRSSTERNVAPPPAVPPFVAVEDSDALQWSRSGSTSLF